MNVAQQQSKNPPKISFSRWMHPARNEKTHFHDECNLARNEKIHFRDKCNLARNEKYIPAMNANLRQREI